MDQQKHPLQKNKLGKKELLAIGALGALAFGAFLDSGFAAVPKTFSRTAEFFKPATLKLKNWGLYLEGRRSHIQVADAWKITEGSHRIVVAVVDTGLDASHPNLRANVWKGSPSVANERCGLSKNAPIYGWDFTTNCPNPKDTHGHGTHVAGILGATPDSEQGVSGVAQKVSIMGVKYYAANASGATNLSNTIKALDWAIDHGARIINYSGGGAEFSEGEYQAIRRAEAKGILVVAAAGNERSDTDRRENYYYPAAYGLSNIISVAATNKDNQLIEHSNWGRTKVDVAAPGDNIFSTLPGARYGTMTGTSQATAFVTGLAALMLSKNPELTPAKIKEIIKLSVDPVAPLQNKVASGGRINAYTALLVMMNGGKLPKSRPELIAARPGSTTAFFKAPGSHEIWEKGLENIEF